MASIPVIRKYGFKLQFNIQLLLILMMISSTELTFIRQDYMHGVQIKRKRFYDTRLNYSVSENQEDSLMTIPFKFSIGQLLQRNKRDNQSQDDTTTEKPMNTTSQLNGSSSNGTCDIGQQLALFLTLLVLNIILLVVIFVLIFFICCREKKAAKPMEHELAANPMERQLY